MSDFFENEDTINENFDDNCFEYFGNEDCERNEQYIDIPFNGQLFNVCVSELDKLDDALGGNLADILTNGIYNNGYDRNKNNDDFNILRPFEEFLRQYPDVNINELEKDFFELVDSGFHPCAVYERLQAQKEIEGYKNQIAAMNKNFVNNISCIGSLEGSFIESDAFLDGFGI